MLNPSFNLVLLLLVGQSVSIKIPLIKSKRSIQARASTSHYAVNVVTSDNQTLDLSTVHDLIYIANITLGNISYPVQFDTGSSDLWIKGDTYPLPNSQLSDISYNITYGIGWANGSIAYASAEFAEITVTQQAFLDAASANNPALGYGADGILGLGFTSLSTIDKLVNNTGASTGRSLLYNLFQDNPSEPNFITFSMQRTQEDDDDDVEGAFTIGEFVEEYESVNATAAISTFPVVSPNRWNVLLEAILVGDTAYTPSTTIANAPSNRGVALLDSGTSYTYAPTDLCEAIYGTVDGASYDDSLGQWVVPCNAEIDMAIQIAGNVYPLHPLDVSPKSLTDTTTCVGSFIPQSVSVGAGEFDILLGDNVLRSVYSVYDFGDFDSDGNMGNPYVKLLSLIDPDEASSEFAAARGTTARTGITYQAVDNAAAEAASTSVTLSTDVAETLDKIGKYFPAMLGVMALNALVLIGLVVLGVLYMCKGRKKNSKPRSPMGRMTPMPTNPRNSYIAGEHTYEPVSMAITEDTLMSPSGGFHKFDGSTLLPGDRPRSMAPLYHRVGSDDQLFVPPSPGFTTDGRPKSVGMSPSSNSMIYPTKTIPEDEPFKPPTTEFPSIDENDDGDIGSKTIDGSNRPANIAIPPRHLRQGSSPFDSPSSMHSPSIRSFHQSQGSIHSILSARSNSFPVDDAGPAIQPSRPSYPPPSSPNHSFSAPSSAIHPPEQGTSALPAAVPRRGVTLTDRPMSAVIPAVYPPRSMSEDAVLSPPTPSFRRSPLRQASVDRPMSVGYLPSQDSTPAHPTSVHADGAFTASPAFSRGQGSFLRPGSTEGADRPMSMA